MSKYFILVSLIGVFIIGGISMAFAAYLSVAGIPQTIAEALLGLASNKVVLFVLI